MSGACDQRRVFVRDRTWEDLRHRRVVSACQTSVYPAANASLAIDACSCIAESRRSRPVDPIVQRSLRVAAGGSPLGSLLRWNQPLSSLKEKP